ncbi:probable E3 ubiquitin-protein ligase ZFP1 [Tanacetum coccineum]
MVYTGPLIDTETEQAHLQSEPCLIPYGQGHIPSGITFMAAPSGPRVVPLPVNPGLHNQLTYPYNHIMDGVHGAFKGKVAEGFHVNFQYSYPAPGSSAFIVPDHRGLDVVTMVMGPGHHTGARNQTDGAIDLNSGVQFMLMSHGAQGQLIQVVPGPWLDQQFCGIGLGIPFMQGYANGALVTFVHPPPPIPQLPPMPRFVRPVPPIGVRVLQPHGQELMIEPTSGHRGFPHLRVLPEDGVAMLNFGTYGHRVDHHRDMRLDIDHMSYEASCRKNELLALGEQIGNAGSTLSDDFIRGGLKTRIFTSFKACSHPGEVSSTDQELNFCTICQMDYNDQEKIGMLDCSHEYHVDCIEKWLVVKNTCPVCKGTGLATQIKESGNLEEP